MKLKILDFIRKWRARLASDEDNKGLARRAAMPAGMMRPVVVAGLCALAALVWLADHDAQVRQASELTRLRKESGAQISSLKAQAESARRDADRQRAQAIRELKAKQAKLAHAGEELRERLAALQEEERKQVELAATLPTSEVATRVAARLGLPSPRPGGLREAGLATPSLPAPRLREAGLPSSSADQGRSSPASPAGETKVPAGSELRLDESAERRVAADLAQLDACQAQSATLKRLVENCNAQAATQADLIQQQSASIKDLHQALADQDRMVAQLKKEHQAELKAVRGSRWHRLVRTLEHVGVGVAIGVAIR